MGSACRLMYLTILGAMPLMANLQAADAPKPITVALVGDSTVTDDAGWGKAFATLFNEQVTVKNLACGGRSSKSWKDENRWPKVVKVKPDYVLIQFGHNDQPGKGSERETDPKTSFRKYLMWYVKETRALGAQPIIVSSVTRRVFKHGKLHDTLKPWAEGAKAVAEETKTPFVDLHTLSVALHQKLGEEGNATFNMNGTDRTHLSPEGAKQIAEIVAGELKKAAKDLAGYLKAEAK